MKLKSIDVFPILVTLLAIALGITGKVDWWVITLILLSHIHFQIEL